MTQQERKRKWEEQASPSSEDKLIPKPEKEWAQKCQDRTDPPTVKGAEFPRKDTYRIPYPQDSSSVHSYLDFFESQWDRNSRTLCARALSRGFTSLGFFCSGCHVQKPQEAPQTASSPVGGGNLHYWPSLDLQGGTTSRTAAKVPRHAARPPALVVFRNHKRHLLTTNRGALGFGVFPGTDFVGSQ